MHPSEAMVGRLSNEALLDLLCTYACCTEWATTAAELRKGEEAAAVYREEALRRMGAGADHR